MAPRMEYSVLLIVCSFLVSAWGQKGHTKMGYVNAGYGCNKSFLPVKCNAACMSSGYLGGMCIKIFCICLPDFSDKRAKAEFQREYDEKISFPALWKGPKT